MTCVNDPAEDVRKLIDRLLEHCDGHPHAKIAWPHRILHEATDALAALSAENARLRQEIELK